MTPTAAVTVSSTPGTTVETPRTLGEPPSVQNLASRMRHAIDDALDRYDAERSPDDAKAAAELSWAHRALDG